MKKILCLLLCIAVLMTMSIPCFAAESGDVDGNGNVTAADARLALRAAASLEKLTDEQAAAADMDGDGSVNAADARKILRKASKLDGTTSSSTEKTTTPPSKDFNTIPTVAVIDSNTVFITPTGKKYHKRDCRTLNATIAAVDREKAIEFGYEPCKFCFEQ